MHDYEEIKPNYLAIKLGLPLMVIFACVLFLFSLARNDDNYTSIDTKGERIKYSIYYKYDGKIYAMIPSGGYYQVEGADAKTFKLVDSDPIYNNSVGVDKDHVYFGNQKIGDLNAKTIKYIGNGYYSDGKNIYFCSNNSVRNPNLPVIVEAFQSIVYTLTNDKKPQSYIYPYQKLEGVKDLVKFDKLSFFARSGNRLYYMGKALKNADPHTIRTVSEKGEFFCDAKNVYYKDEILPIKNSGQLEYLEIPQEDYFLYDKKTGHVFNGTYMFDKDHAPYKYIGNNSKHAHSMFFTSKDGLYFYNSKKQKIERSGDNPFSGDVRALTDNVFADNDRLYYLNSFEEVRYGKHRIPRAYIKHTILVAFDKKDGWKKVGDIDHGIVGSLWEKNGQYYYFDNLGNSQLIKDTVYKVRDKKVLDLMLSNIKGENNDNITDDWVRSAIEDKKMEPISGETISDAGVTVYGTKSKILNIIYCTLGFGLLILSRRYYWKSRKYFF